jgi:hypothetical protein
VDLQFHSPIRLNGVVLNYLSTGANLPFTYSVTRTTFKKRGRILFLGTEYFWTLLYFYSLSWDSAVGVATGYKLDDRGVGVQVPVVKNFLFSTSSRLALGPTQPPIQWVQVGFFPRVKRPGREADHSPPTSAEV